MASEEDTVESYIKAFNDQDPKNLYINPDKAIPFLFEYACQTLESENHSPVEYASQIPSIMIIHLESIVERFMMNLWDTHERKEIKFPNKDIIPFLIDQDQSQPQEFLNQYESSDRNSL